MRKVPIAPDVKADIIARGTPGFSGADLANLVNEAALFAARGNKRLVDMDDFERAKDKIIMGAERRSMVMPEEERSNTAYHESGHAIVARLLPKTDPVHKVTIIPRGRALGVTMQLPEQDRYSMDRDRPAEHDRGAVRRPHRRRAVHEPDDHRRVERLRARDRDRARHGDALRHVRRARPDGLRRERGRGVPRPLDHHAQERVRGDDAEGRRRDPHASSTSSTRVARKLLEENRDKVEAMAKALLEWETIDADQIDDIMAGKPPRPPKPSGSQTAGQAARDGRRAAPRARPHLQRGRAKKLCAADVSS